jgi:hypothetical protein
MRSALYQGKQANSSPQNFLILSDLKYVKTRRTEISDGKLMLRWVIRQTGREDVHRTELIQDMVNYAFLLQ